MGTCQRKIQKRYTAIFTANWVCFKNLLGIGYEEKCRQYQRIYRFSRYVLTNSNFIYLIYYLESFIQKTERSLLENPYKLDKQLAALDQELADFLNPAKRQRLEVNILF